MPNSDLNRTLPPTTPSKRPGALTKGSRRLMYILGLGLIFLIANSVYLASVSSWGFWDGANHENFFYMWMVLGHLVLGLGMIPIFLIFIGLHLKSAFNHRNRLGKRTGFVLGGAFLVVILSGLLMTVRLLPLESVGGRVTYWLHVLVPILSVFLYVMHRSYGPRLKWRWGAAYVGSILTVLLVMAFFHSTDPREWKDKGSGVESFLPARVRTQDGALISEKILMMDQYCQDCHPDAVKDHNESVHHFSSFNNPIYLFSVRESREALLKRDNDVRGTRFCAGCHDPVPLLSGAFDDPDYDFKNAPSAQEGVNCTVCHGITDVVGTIGNGNYTFEEPLHYPFTFSENPALRWVNRQLVKAKPAFHKKTFLKPLHKSAEFCAVCHKVNIPYELNHYKEWLRGQNHYDNFLLSGVSGHGARSFYYPPKAEPNCNECHMPKKASDDFGAQDGEIHDHHFPGANSALPKLKGLLEAQHLQEDFLKDGQMDIDIFALRKDGRIDGELLAPLGVKSMEILPGESYLVEVVIRTLKLGHVFTQGTSDSNEVWVEIEARAGDRLIGESGRLDQDRKTDPWSHYVNSLILDKDGNRIERRNVQDIFTTLYSNMMGPGTGQVVHYALTIPADVVGPIKLTAKLHYRKFDRTLMNHVWEDLRKRGESNEKTPDIPIVTLCEDEVVLLGDKRDLASSGKSKPLWQRWRDYGIGLLLSGNSGSTKGELRQAAEAFKKVTELGQPIGWLDLARVFEKEGRLKDARSAIVKAINGGIDNPWTANWLTGRIESQLGNYQLAIQAFDRVLSTKIVERGFDFSLDYQVIFEKGRAEFLWARSLSGEARKQGLKVARGTLERVLELDSEHLATHYNLMLIYRLMGDKKKAQLHKGLHAKYRPDDNAREHAVSTYRAKSESADKAAESIVIYDLNRKGTLVEKK